MKYFVRQIDLLLWVFWQGWSKIHGILTIWTARMALAHYASAKTEKRFSLRKLDQSIYVVGAVDGLGEPYCAPLFCVGTPAQAQQLFEGSSKDNVFFIMDLHEFRTIAAEALAKGDVEYE